MKQRELYIFSKIIHEQVSLEFKPTLYDSRGHALNKFRMQFRQRVCQSQKHAVQLSGVP